VGVLGAGAWARGAHLPGYRRDPRCKVVAIADVEIDRARDAAREFEVATATADPNELLRRDDIDLIDVCTPSHTHFELAWAALEAGKHVLCEKPVAYDYRDTLRAADLARRKGLKTKVGLTFRYSPAMRYMKTLIDQGKTEDQAVAAKPTAQLDEKWGKGFMKADDFVHMAYQSLKP